MSMDGADWLRTQLTSFGCALCGQPYESNRIRLLAERDGLFFVDLACTHCGTQAVAIVTIQADDDEIRLDAGDAISLLANAYEPAEPPVTADDVIAIHELLSGFRGGVDELFAHLDGRVGQDRA